jgi:hypothetical protein
MEPRQEADRSEQVPASINDLSSELVQQVCQALTRVDGGRPLAPFARTAKRIRHEAKDYVAKGPDLRNRARHLVVQPAYDVGAAAFVLHMGPTTRVIHSQHPKLILHLTKVRKATETRLECPSPDPAANPCPLKVRWQMWSGRNSILRASWRIRQRDPEYPSHEDVWDARLRHCLVVKGRWQDPCETRVQCDNVWAKGGEPTTAHSMHLALRGRPHDDARWVVLPMLRELPDAVHHKVTAAVVAIRQALAARYPQCKTDEREWANYERSLALYDQDHFMLPAARVSSLQPAYQALPYSTVDRAEQEGARAQAAKTSVLDSNPCEAPDKTA